MGKGILMALVMGVAALVISVIIAFVIVQEVANVESDLGSTLNTAIINESGSINQTGYTLAHASDTGFASPVLIALYNNTDGTTIVLANATVTGAGVVTNTTDAGSYDDALISYTYDSQVSTITTENLRANFTAGIDEVSSKIPTVLLIAAVVLILGILVLLWTQYKRMDIGSGGGL